MEKTIYEGCNVKRIREMLGIKQEALAIKETAPLIVFVSHVLFEINTN